MSRMKNYVRSVYKYLSNKPQRRQNSANDIDRAKAEILRVAINLPVCVCGLYVFRTRTGKKHNGSERVDLNL